MFKKIILSLTILCCSFSITYAGPQTFDENIISNVVTWDETKALAPQREINKLDYFTPDYDIVLGKVIKIEPVFPPHNEMPHGLVTLMVYEGDNEGDQIKFVTKNVFFVCKPETPYPHCQSRHENMGTLQSTDNPDIPWVLPGDTVILALRPYNIQIEGTTGETKVIDYARFIKGEYDKGIDQDTYRQKRERFADIFKPYGKERKKDLAISDAYGFLRLTRVKDGKVSQILRELANAIK